MGTAVLLTQRATCPKYGTLKFDRASYGFTDPCCHDNDDDQIADGGDDVDGDGGDDDEGGG